MCFYAQKSSRPLRPATFKIFTSHPQPGTHRTSDNRIRPLPKELDAAEQYGFDFAEKVSKGE